MRKVALMLVFVIMASTLVSAQVRRATPAAPAKPATVAPTATAKANEGFVGVSLNQPTVPSVRFGLGSWSLDVGLTISSPVAGRTDYSLLLRGEIPISEVTDNLRTYFAPQITLANIANQTAITLFLLLGGEYMFAPHLAVFADLNALTITSAAATTTWAAGTNSNSIYTGARLYF